MFQGPLDDIFYGILQRDAAMITFKEGRAAACISSSATHGDSTTPARAFPDGRPPASAWFQWLRKWDLRGS